MACDFTVHYYYYYATDRLLIKQSNEARSAGGPAGTRVGEQTACRRLAPDFRTAIIRRCRIRRCHGDGVVWAPSCEITICPLIASIVRRRRTHGHSPSRRFPLHGSSDVSVSGIISVFRFQEHKRHSGCANRQGNCNPILNPNVTGAGSPPNSNPLLLITPLQNFHQNSSTTFRVTRQTNGQTLGKTHPS